MTCQLPKIYLPQFYEGQTILQYRRYPEIITRRRKSTDRKYNVPQYITHKPQDWTKRIPPKPHTQKQRKPYRVKLGNDLVAALALLFARYKNHVINHEWEKKDALVTITKTKYHLSYMTQTFRDSKQVMIATVNISKWWPTILPPGTLGSFAETLYQENHELKHKLWNIISTQLLCIYRYAEDSRWEN